MIESKDSNRDGISPWFLAAALLCAIPVFIPYYPPMLDLPQHVAAIMVLDESLFGDYRYADLFEFNWYRPYWFGYVAIWLLSKPLGLLLAAKVVIAASLVSTVLCFALLRREVRAPAMLDWYFLAIPFGFAYHWGFLSFIVCIPLLPLFLVFYHRYLDGRLSAWIIAVWMILLFFGHLLILAFACLAASSMAVRPPVSMLALIKRVAPLLLSIPMGVGWILMTIQPRNTENPMDWNLGLHRVVNFFPDIFGLERSPLIAVVAFLLLCLPFMLGVRPKWRLHHLLPAAFYAGFMMLVPTMVYDNFGTYERFQVFGLMFFTLLLSGAEVEKDRSKTSIRRAVQAIPPIIGIFLLLRVGLQSYGFHLESKDYRLVSSSLEPEERVLSLVGDRVSLFSPVPVYVHFPLWYQVETKGLVDFNFARWPSMNVHYKATVDVPVDEVLAWYPQLFRWDKYRADHYRYIIVRGQANFAGQIQQIYQDRLNLVASRGMWHAFERIEPEVSGD